MKRVVLIAALLAIAGDAFAVGPPFPSSNPGTVACNSGVSPCTITNTAANVLAANVNRTGCLLQVVGNATLYCKKATAAASLASSTNFDFLLQGTAAASPGNSYSCDGPFSIWTGPINCIASSSQSATDLAVVETQ